MAGCSETSRFPQQGTPLSMRAAGSAAAQQLLPRPPGTDILTPTVCLSAVGSWGPWFLWGLFAAILVWEEVWDLPNTAYLSAWLLILITAGPSQHIC